MPGMGDEMERPMQQAPQPMRQSTGGLPPREGYRFTRIVTPTHLLDGSLSAASRPFTPPAPLSQPPPRLTGERGAGSPKKTGRSSCCFQTNLSLFSRRTGGRLGEEGRGDEGHGGAATGPLHVVLTQRRRTVSMDSRDTLSGFAEHRRLGRPQVQLPGPRPGRLLKGLTEDGEETAPRPLHGAEARQMFGVALAIHQGKAPADE